MGIAGSKMGLSFLLSFPFLLFLPLTFLEFDVRPCQWVISTQFPSRKHSQKRGKSDNFLPTYWAESTKKLRCRPSQGDRGWCSSTSITESLACLSCCIPLETHQKDNWDWDPYGSFADVLHAFRIIYWLLGDLLSATKSKIWPWT